MTALPLLHLIRREARGMGVRGAFFVASMAVGVAAVVAVAGLAGAIDGGIRSQSRELLSGDLVVASRRALPAELDEIVASVPGVTRVATTELATMAATADGERSVLVQVKAVSPGYPLYGAVQTDPAEPLDSLLGADGALVTREGLARLGLQRGDTVRLGGTPFTVAGTLLSEPDRIAASFTPGPRVLVSQEGLARTGLVALGSRSRHRALLRLADSDPRVVAALGQRLKAELPDATYLRIQTADEALPELRTGIRRVESFLGLVALLSLLMGGVGVAQAVRSWLATRMDSVAVLRCLGLRSSEVMAVYVGQALLLAVAGSTIGVAGGLAVQWLVPELLAGVLPPVELSLWQPSAILRGVAVGVAVAALFSVPPLLVTRRVPPLRVLRRDVEPMRSGLLARGATVAALVAGIVVLAAVQARSLTLGVQFAGSVVGTTAVLLLVALVVTRLLARVPRLRLRLWLRSGLAAVARPGADTTGAIVALGLGVLVVLAMALVERNLSRQLAADLPRNAPSDFLIDIQPDQWPALRQLLLDAGVANLTSVPLITARLREVDGVAVSQMTTGEERRERWALTREQRLTSLASLPADNQVVAGTWFSDPTVAEASVEEEFAGEIGARLGSRLVLDVQGVPVEVTVTSIRKVEWRTFNINFFLVVEPGILDDAPQSRIAAGTVPREREASLQGAIARGFPNVTVIPIRDVLERVSAVVVQLGLGVRFLGAFTMVAGIAILGGAASARAARRGREVALLKTLGFTRSGVAAVFAVEYALVGAVAGVIGAAGGTLLAYLVLTRGMEISLALEALPVAAALVGTAVLTAVAGLIASTSALRRRPIEVLRQE